MKKKSPLRSLGWVLALQYRTSRRFFIWNIFYSLYDGVDSIINTFLVAKFFAALTTFAVQRGNTRPMYVWLVLLSVMQLLTVALRNGNNLAEKRFEQKIELATNQILFTKMYQLSQEQFDDEAFYTRLDRAIDALNQMRFTLRELTFTLSSVITLVGSVGAIVIVSPLVGIVLLAVSVPVSIIKFRQNKLTDQVARKTEPVERIGYRTRWFLVDPRMMPEVRIINAFKQLLGHWKTAMVSSHKHWYRHDKSIAGMTALTDTVQPVMTLVASIYFLRLFIANQLALDKFIFLRGLLDQASNSAVMVASSLERLHELSINLNNFSEIYETEPSIPNGTVKIKAPLAIEFKNVSFRYQGATDLALDDVSFRIFPRSRLALVGENGAGKSTLIKLLLRQYLPTSGTITVNGTDIKEIEQESYYRAIGNLSQDFLMVPHLTIKDNLVLGLEKAVSNSVIYKTTDLVGATEFIKKLPYKLKQRLDASFKDGTGLSGGQMQRLGVARALLRGGDIMILDEPTSAIDAKAEYAIFNNIYQAHGDKTTLIVSHRFSTVRKADKIIVMERGKITEYGSHEELIAYGGLYKEMFEAQAEGYK